MSVLRSGDRVGDRYVINTEIGRGGMQEVYKAFDETFQRDVALKVPQDGKSALKFQESAVISARVNHPNVAKTFDYLDDSPSRSYMVEELVEGLNLKELGAYFERIDPHIVAHVLHHLARGVAASHRAGVVHRDLKPSNVLVADGLSFRNIKITDFGIAKMAGHEIGEAVAGGKETTESSSTARGQIAYMAPEVIQFPRKPSKPADVWAIAAIAWELLTGLPPFGSGYVAVANILLGKKPSLPNPIAKHRQFGQLSMQIHEVILKCFDLDPSNRPTADTLAALCDDLCYLPPVRETGVVQNYPGNVTTFGFIWSDNGTSVFFHTRSVVGPRPATGTRVWFTKFDGQPNPRAFPVVPIKTLL